MTDHTDSVDYAVVGGGVSGLYTAWRLLADSTERPTVRVFEQSDRLGGKLLTWNPGGDDAGLRAELGGMRFFEQQELVWRLLDVLDLGDQRIPFFADGYPGLIWQLRGLRMNAGDFTTADRRYLLKPNEQTPPFSLINSVIQEVLADNDVHRTPTDRKGWDELKPRLRYQGRELWKVGFWNLLADKLSTEAYNYMIDSFGYYTLALNWNAAEAFQNVSLDFTQNPRYETLSKGYDGLPLALGDKVRELGGEESVQLGTTLERVDADVETGGPGLLLHLTRDGEAQRVRARHVVLAMPRRSLELLERSDVFDIRNDRRLRRLIRSVRPYPAFKLFLLYDQRWWDDAGYAGQVIEHGRSVSDMPIRQTYYMRPDSCESGADCPPYGLIMASYDDAVAVDFWRGLEPTEEELPANDRGLVDVMLRNFSAFNLQGAEPRSRWQPPPVLHGAPPQMIDHARAQLALLHGRLSVPAPVYGAFADWSTDPFGGGWLFWEPQHNPKEVMPAVRTPVPEYSLHVVGEAYSGQQGWVEGALTTAELVLRDDFKIPQPHWLQDIYLGW
ncbi:FAD-dependent oxidoreductase [Actinosynnema sp. NPDC023658]|uniref:flavin monoamine oxidase family protein n=1 Tax=Actinosynnema sp. NPDC023658 TaxID=3155465 RepID=UPI0033D7AA24